MSFDLKIFESVNGTLVGSTWPQPDYVDGEYSLVQMITKCLLTNPGEDLFDLTYGSGLRAGLIGVPGQSVDIAKRVTAAALNKVVDDLTTVQATDPAETLVSLSLLSMSYDPIRTTWNVAVQVQSGTGSFPINLTTE